MNNELKHYGVLGMKWGIRRARKKNKEYNYKSLAQRKYERKLKRAKNDYDRIRFQQKLDMYKDRDKRRQNYAERTSVGKTIAQTLLFGPIGKGSYTRIRAANHGRIASYLAVLLTNTTLIGGVAVSKIVENQPK